VPAAEKRRRLNALLDLQEGIGLERNQAWVGRETEVLVDELRPAGSHEPAAGPRLAGRNRENKLVHFPGEPALIGTRVTVRVDRAGPYALVGSLAS
jgi:tRNA-2-methylthio-N6-dimethylallyladenosine synthase